MKSISVSWSSNVKEEEAVQGLAAIAGVITALYHTRWPLGLISPIVSLHPFGNWVIPALEVGSPYSSFDWYVNNAFEEDWEAIDEDRFLNLVEDEPWQQHDHHYDFSMVHLPLRSDSSPEPLALASRPGVATVISLDWVRWYRSLEMQRLAIRRLSCFGIGRAFDLEPHTDDESLCAMRSFAGHDDLLSKAVEEHREGVIYCDDHFRHLLGILLSGRQSLS